MLFRATLFRNTERFGSWFGVITIGITFGLWHCNYEQFFYTAVLGICAAFLTAKTRSVLPAMAIHFTMNFIGTMLSIAYSGLDLDNLDLEVMTLQYASAFPNVNHIIMEHDKTWIDFFEKTHSLNTM